MSTRTALITGISGQDGSYLAEYLLSHGYNVHGIVRRQSVAENQSSRLSGVINKVTLHYGDVTDAHAVSRLINEVRPNELYHLAGQSHGRRRTAVPSGPLHGHGT